MKSSSSLLIAQDALAEAEAEVEQLLKDLEHTSLELLHARQQLSDSKALAATSTHLASAALATRALPPQYLAPNSSLNTSSPPWVFSLASTTLAACLSLYSTTFSSLLSSSTAHFWWWSKPLFPSGPSFHAMAQFCQQTLPAQTLPVLLLGLFLWAGRRHTFLALLPLTLCALVGALAAHTFMHSNTPSTSSSSSSSIPPLPFWDLLLSPIVLASTVVGAFLTTSHATGVGVKARTEDWSILSRLSAPAAGAGAFFTEVSAPSSSVCHSAYVLFKGGAFLLLACLRVAALSASLVLSIPVLLLPPTPTPPFLPPPLCWAILALWWVGCGVLDLGAALMAIRALRGAKARFLLLLERTSSAHTSTAASAAPTPPSLKNGPSPPPLPHRIPHIMAHLGEQERAAWQTSLGAATCLWVTAGACFVLSNTASSTSSMHLPWGWVMGGQGGLPPHQLFLAAFAPHLAVLLGRRG